MMKESSTCFDGPSPAHSQPRHRAAKAIRLGPSTGISKHPMTYRYAIGDRTRTPTQKTHGRGRYSVTADLRFQPIDSISEILEPTGAVYV